MYPPATWRGVGGGRKAKGEGTVGHRGSRRGGPDAQRPTMPPAQTHTHIHKHIHTLARAPRPLSPAPRCRSPCTRCRRCTERCGRWSRWRPQPGRRGPALAATKATLTPSAGKRARPPSPTHNDSLCSRLHAHAMGSRCSGQSCYCPRKRGAWVCSTRSSLNKPAPSPHLHRPRRVVQGPVKVVHPHGGVRAVGVAEGAHGGGGQQARARSNTQ